MSEDIVNGVQKSGLVTIDLDDIELSLKHADKIRDYESKIKLK